MHLHIPTSLAAAVAISLGLAACADDGEGGSSTSATSTCPSGLVPKYDPNTGKLAGCVLASDGGGTADGGSVGGGSDGGGSDGGSAKDTTLAASCKPGLGALDRWWLCPPETSHPGKALHGQPCQADADCLYGLCLFGLPLAGYDKSIGICSKNCGFDGGKLAPCALEDGNPVAGDAYYCTIEKTVQSGNSLQDTGLPGPFKMCAHGCKTDADCKAWNPALPTCLKQSTPHLSTNPNGICARLVLP
jgi:hypothetical protein